jgi:hypothetical protein
LNSLCLVALVSFKFPRSKLTSCRDRTSPPVERGQALPGSPHTGVGEAAGMTSRRLDGHRYQPPTTAPLSPSPPLPLSPSPGVYGTVHTYIRIRWTMGWLIVRVICHIQTEEAAQSLLCKLVGPEAWLRSLLFIKCRDYSAKYSGYSAKYSGQIQWPVRGTVNTAKQSFR